MLVGRSGVFARALPVSSDGLFDANLQVSCACRMRVMNVQRGCVTSPHKESLLASFGPERALHRGTTPKAVLLSVFAELRTGFFRFFEFFFAMFSGFKWKMRLWPRLFICLWGSRR